ncbi:MAG: hypothetical protein H0V82_02550 [Candidatus Protochlamydia sp.]|nr:hypothetical protein [Candidatus Protochlamydia sp.]
MNASPLESSFNSILPELTSVQQQINVLKEEWHARSVEIVNNNSLLILEN